LKQNLNRTNTLLEERNNSLDDRQREVETLNHLLARLQIEYEKSKNDLSLSHDQIVQHEIGNQTLKQHLTEKTNEVKKTRKNVSSFCSPSFLVINNNKSSSSNSTRSSYI
jgi:chromosome segregation ATPase